MTQSNRLGANGSQPPYVSTISTRNSGNQLSSAQMGSKSLLAQNMAKSMTIEEMRLLHQHALNEAESKRTELKLVLASRYRELVGSSDEVIKMKDRAQELSDLTQALPSLILKVGLRPSLKYEIEEEKDTSQSKTQELLSDQGTMPSRIQLASLPKLVHRALDKNDVYLASLKVIELFNLIVRHTDAYQLVNKLTANTNRGVFVPRDHLLDIQIRMVFLQMQSIPRKICRTASNVLTKSASFEKSASLNHYGAQRSAAALAALNLLETEVSSDRAEWLLSMYFDSKSKLLISLLENLMSSTSTESSDSISASVAEGILSKIVLILQYDVILHPYLIFTRRLFPVKIEGECETIMGSLPQFNSASVRTKCSKFLASNLQLIRTKVKTVLVSIAGTTASALGQIRQSLYDRTDGSDSIQKLNDNGICQWDDAVTAMVETQTVLCSSGDSQHADGNQKFSLWGALFSGTFSSLVHSLLTTAFQSVHTDVISNLQLSLSRAPPLSSILPHEACRNTLTIATSLDEALCKVSQDAHELLVHAEERDESERRLKQSLYVQTCEIMGRLICELRLIASGNGYCQSQGSKHLIIGRLCYHLKFRLQSLPALLSLQSSPSSMRAGSGMISFIDLRSAFEVADHDGDRLIGYEEALEAVDSAFAGTPFHALEIVRETLFLSTELEQIKSGCVSSFERTQTNVTLNELALLTARGLRHEISGPESALGLLQQSLDAIVLTCFEKWSSAALLVAATSFEDSFNNFVRTASSSDEEWCRLFANSSTFTSNSKNMHVKKVSPYVIELLLECSLLLNRNICPSDSMAPIKSIEHALGLGIQLHAETAVPTLTDTIRRSILYHLSTCVESKMCLIGDSSPPLSQDSARFVFSGSGPACSSAISQLYMDVLALQCCLAGSNEDKVANALIQDRPEVSNTRLNLTIEHLERVLKQKSGDESLVSLSHSHLQSFQCHLESSHLFFSSLLGTKMSKIFSKANQLEESSAAVVPFDFPLNSSRRFVQLSIQADQSVNDIQLRLQSKEKEQALGRQENTTGNVMSTGFGFFSSMLKKK